jgi:hypothetical protein
MPVPPSVDEVATTRGRLAGRWTAEVRAVNAMGGAGPAARPTVKRWRANTATLPTIPEWMVPGSARRHDGRTAISS